MLACFGEGVGFLWREVSDDVFHSGDGRQGCGAIAFFAEALSDAGVDEVSEVFREPRLFCGIWLDDSEVFRHLDELVQVPPVQIIWFWFRGQFSARPECRDGTRDLWRWARLESPEKQSLGRGTRENRGGFILAVRQGSGDSPDVVS